MADGWSSNLGDDLFDDCVTQRLQPLVDDYRVEGKYDKQVMFAILINYMVGVGYLTIPYAFDRAGVVLATFITIIAAFTTYLTSLWVAQSSHRGMQLIEESQRTSIFGSGLRVATSLSSQKSRRKSRATGHCGGRRAR